MPAPVVQIVYLDETTGGILGQKFLSPFLTTDSQVIVPNGHLDGDVSLIESLGNEIGYVVATWPIGTGTLVIS